MTRYTFTILLLFCTLFVAAQKDSFRLLRVIPVAAADMTVDNLDNIYIITHTGQLKKLNATGDSVGVFNDVRRFGKPALLDVTNPLKLLVFYKDQSTVVILDRQLALKSQLDLRRINIPQVSAIGNSYDNNIWAFDAVDNKLKKIDEQGNVLMETVDLRLVLNEEFVPDKILDQNGSVYLYDADGGILEFNYYGALQRRYPFTNSLAGRVNEKNIITIQNDLFIVYNKSSLLEQQYQFPSSFGSFNRYIIGNTKLFAMSKDSIHVYSFPF